MGENDKGTPEQHSKSASRTTPMLCATAVGSFGGWLHTRDADTDRTPKRPVVVAGGDAVCDLDAPEKEEEADGGETNEEPKEEKVVEGGTAEKEKMGPLPFTTQGDCTRSSRG